ncbi:MAG: PAS domain S-box protein, partial [Chloroflexi bacterium]|nr:PAS domain S-box protein [Chloroflexota bacterium]
FLRGDGTVVWTVASNTAVRDEQGEFLYLVQAIQDVTERVENERKLRESEERFRSLFEAAPIGIQIVKAGSQVPFGNGALAKILDRSLEVVDGVHLREFRHPAYPPEIVNTESDLETGTDQLGYERVFKRPDGTAVWCQVTAAAVRNDDGSLKQIIRMIEDVTARKRAEEELAGSERRFRNLFDQAPMGIATLDADGIILRSNQTLPQILGFDVTELEGHPFKDRAQNGVSRGMYDRIVAGEIEIDRSEWNLEPRPNAAEWVRFTTTSVRDDDGDFEYGVSMVEDISERKRFERELLASQEQFKMLFETVPVGIALLDPDGVVRQANAAMGEILGCAVTEILGRRLRYWLDEGMPLSATTTEMMHAKSLDQGEGEAEFRKGDGSVITGRQKTISIRDANGAIRYFIRTFEDVTQQREVQRRIARQIKTDGQADERERIARDMHDTVVQDLTAIAMRLELAKKMAEAGQPGLAQHLESTDEFARATLRNARDVVWDLWTDVISGSSFSQALEFQAEREAASAGVGFSFEQSGDIRELPRPVQAALLRIVREAANNVGKHAAASSVSVKLMYLPEAVRLEVLDDGIGFDLTNRRANDLGGFGLTSMFERAKLVGGAVEVDRGHEGGTLLSVTVPA